MKHLFIINPAAGKRDHTEDYRRAVLRAAEERPFDYRIEVSGAPGQCREIARRAAETGEDYRIYACGGDGTLNEVVSGICGYPNVAVTHFAGGSGNDFVKIFSEPAAFCDLNRLLDCRETTFDLIACGEDRAVNVLSVGFDARIGTEMARYKRLPLVTGPMAYGLSAAVNLVRGVAEHYVVEIDGKRLDQKFSMICVCNGRYYGGGFNPVPEADPADGKLDVLLVEPVSRFQVVKIIGAYKAGKYRDYPDLIHHIRTDRLRILCDRETPVNLDGELRLRREVEVAAAPEKIRFFYPKALTWRQPAPVQEVAP